MIYAESNDFMSNNITKHIKNINKINIVKALGYDEKYINGSASDFEWFDMWESASFLCVGHSELSSYADELQNMGLGIAELSKHCRESCIFRWRHFLKAQNIELEHRVFFCIDGEKKAGEYVLEGLKKIEKAQDIVFVDINKYVSYFTTNVSSLSDASERIYDVVVKHENACKILILDMSEGKYERPDPYAANKLFLRKKSDGFLNSTEENIVFSQVLIELLIRCKKDENIGVYIRNTGGASSALSLASYLGARRLFEGEIWVDINNISDLELILNARLYPNIIVRPHIDARRAGVSKEEYLQLFYNYPVGAFVFSGGRECPELLTAIESISQSETHRELLLSITCINSNLSRE